jgi:hypothetical protein
MNGLGVLVSAAGVAAGAALASAASAQSSGGGSKPNIVFVLMDNLGYGELGVYGGGVLRGAPTLRIDQLAAEGTRLTNFNVEAQCTPSRSAIMTGRFPIRSGTQSIPVGGEFDGLTRWEVTIADTLSAAGYATGAFGKWHLGSVPERLPNRRGFDEWYGIPRTTDEAFWPDSPQAVASGAPPMHVMEGRKGEDARDVMVYDLKERRLIDEEITRRTIDFMKRSIADGNRRKQRHRSAGHIGDDAKGVANVKRPRLHGDVGRRKMQSKKTVNAGAGRIGDDFARPGLVEPVNHNAVESGDRAHLAGGAAMEGLQCIRLRQSGDHRPNHGRGFHAAIGLRLFAFDDQEVARQMETEIESLLSPRQQPHSVEPLRACGEEHRHAVADVMRRLIADEAIEPPSQRLLDGEAQKRLQVF